MKLEDVNSWGDKITKYETDISQSVISTETRSLGRQLVYFSFLTLLVAGRFIDTNGGVVGLKFKEELFPIAISVAGLCCIYLLINFIFYSLIDYRKWKTYVNRINNDSNSAVMNLSSNLREHQSDLLSTSNKTNELYGLLNKKWQELGLDFGYDAITKYNGSNYDEIQREMAERDLKFDEYGAFRGYVSNEIHKLNEKNKKNSQYLTAVEDSFRKAIKRSSVIKKMSILVDIFFPISLSLLTICLTFYKSYFLVKLTGFTSIISQLISTQVPI